MFRAADNQSFAPSSDLAKVLLYYPSTNASTDYDDGNQFATNGLTGASANNVSIVATGQQQRASVRASLRSSSFPATSHDADQRHSEHLR